MVNPLEQFLIKTLIPLEIAGYDVSFTNSSLIMVMITALIIGIQIIAIRGRTMVPDRVQAFYEYCFEFVEEMIGSTAGDNAKKYLPLIFSIFLFVLFANLAGMIPFSFTVTSHLAVTFALSFTIFIVVTIIGFMNHGLKFFKLFLPEGAPLWVAPLLIPVEIVSYLIRPLTLAFRLFVNMTAGHILLKVFAGFTVMFGAMGVAPFIFNVMFTGFEFFIALLQAYIFAILSCIYLNDAINLH